MIVEFYKYQGTGNDFIVIDDQKNQFDINDNRLIMALCERKMGIGADGLILLRKHDLFDFEMIYFNSDGYQSSMCGNGSRCILKFAKMLGIIKNEATFIAIDGIHKGKFIENEISIQMTDVKEIKKHKENLILDTGSPHYIRFVNNLMDINVNKEGRKIRNLELFRDNGLNVNFIQYDNEIRMRTYERGVEEETLSCGTGAVAAAIAIHYMHHTTDHLISINTNGGILTVSFEEFNGSYRNIWLSGEAEMVYSGEFVC